MSLTAANWIWGEGETFLWSKCSMSRLQLILCKDKTGSCSFKQIEFLALAAAKMNINTILSFPLLLLTLYSPFFLLWSASVLWFLYCNLVGEGVLCFPDRERAQIPQSQRGRVEDKQGSRNVSAQLCLGLRRCSHYFLLLLPHGCFDPSVMQPTAAEKAAQTCC